MKEIEVRSKEWKARDFRRGFFMGMGMAPVDCYGFERLINYYKT